MTSTRKGAAAGAKQRTSASTPSRQPEPLPAEHILGPTSDPDPVLDCADPEIEGLLASLPQDSKTLVKILKIVFSKQLKSEILSLKEALVEKDKQIAGLKSELSTLKDKVCDLEDHIDRVEQYERRDTIIVSGPALPLDNQLENPKSVVVSVIKENLKLNIKEDDINVAHRLGPVNHQNNRPFIVKLQNRSLKYDLVGACVKLRPNIYVNESLTPKRLSMFKQILAIRKQHRPKFQQCFTKDGNIIVKLQHSTVKHIINDNKSLMNLLEKYPYMMTTYQELVSAV